MASCSASISRSRPTQPSSTTRSPTTAPSIAAPSSPRTPAQAAEAKAYIAQLNRAKAYAAPVVTTVETGKAFYAAEAYHQHFLERNPTYPYIVYNDLPKVAALKKLFPAIYKG